MEMRFTSLNKNAFTAANADVKPNQASIPPTANTQLKQKAVEIKKEDEILASDFLSKQKYKIHAANTLPTYVLKGLKGDPSSNFYEFMQICKIPYFIGGPVLAALFNAGANNINYQSKSFANAATKKIAVGVGLYYMAVALAKLAIDVPVKYFRGVDLNLPYKKIVESKSPDSSIGYLKKTKEYHKVFESIDFTRWQLLHNHEDASKPVNYRYDKMAKKFGFEEPLNDSDSALRPYISKTIIMARAWKYILTVPFVALGLGLAKQNDWGKSFTNVKAAVKDIFSTQKLPELDRALNIKERTIRAKDLFKDNLYKPLKGSINHLWMGKDEIGGKPHGKYAGAIGKTVILAAIFTPIFANYMILKKTSAKRDLAKNIKVELPETTKGGADDK